MPGISKFFKLILLTSLCGAAFLMPVQAQSPAAGTDEDKTIAVVNGHEIKLSEIVLATDDLIVQLPDLPPETRFPFVVEFLMARHLVAQEAVKQGIADTPEYKRRLAFYQAKALYDAYLSQTLRPQVTEAEVKTTYDLEVAKMGEMVEERVRVRHILVNTEGEAQKIEAELKAGAKFADLAKKYSKEAGSAEHGGDIGYFAKEEMVPEFSSAAFQLKVTEISPPIKTDYGWHIIMLEDRKNVSTVPPYEQVKNSIRNVLLRKHIQEFVEKLKDTASIQVLDPDLVKYAEEAKRRAAEVRAQQQQELNGAVKGGNAAVVPTGGAPATDPAIDPGLDDDGKGDLAAPKP